MMHRKYKPKTWREKVDDFCWTFLAIATFYICAHIVGAYLKSAGLI